MEEISSSVKKKSKKKAIRVILYLKNKTEGSKKNPTKKTQQSLTISNTQLTCQV